MRKATLSSISRICTVVAVCGLTLVGCTWTSSPQSSNTPQSGPDQFGFVTNGTSIDSRNDPYEANAQVWLSVNGGNGVDSTSKLLSMQLNYADFVGLVNVHFYTIEIGIPTQGSVLGSYPIGNWSDPTAAQAYEIIDSIDYTSVPGGTVTITKFDTTKNLISGVFNFTAVLSSFTPTAPKNVTVASGYFNDIPIFVGGFGQGSISLNAPGLGFTTLSGRQNQLAAYQFRALPQLNLRAFDDDSIWQQKVSIAIPFPKIGTFNIVSNATGAAQAGIIYTSALDNGPTNLGSSVTGTSGQLIVTKYDTTSHRISAIFDFSGMDQYSGNPMQFTHGVIDNVQWAVE